MTDIPADNGTTAVINGSGSHASALELDGDADWWRVDLRAGFHYDFRLQAGGLNSNLSQEGRMTVIGPDGTGLIDSGVNNWLAVNPIADGTYWIAVRDGRPDNGVAGGSYRIAARMDDAVGNSAGSAGTIAAGVAINGDLGQQDDSDWYALDLGAGITGGFLLAGDGGAGALDRGQMILRDASGKVLSTASGGELTFTSGAAGTYYLEVVDADPFDDAAEGRFVLTTRIDDTVGAIPDPGGARLRDGQTLAGRVDLSGDIDCYAYQVVARHSYAFDLGGYDGHLRLLDATGAVLAETAPGGGPLIWRADRGAQLFLEVSGDVPGEFQLTALPDIAVLTAGAGATTLTGGAVANHMSGSAGDDVLVGGGGNDTLIGAMGDDLLDGGEGIDTALFDAAGGVRVDLRHDRAQQTGQGLDRLLGIENLTTGSGADLLIGSAAGNLLSGNGGSDTIFGLTGNDTIIAGSGDDLIDGGAGLDLLLADGNAPLVLSLLTAGGQITGRGTKSVIGIEDVTGGGGADRITGSHAANRLDGAAGDDVLNGEGGNDHLSGGAGHDRLTGGDGADILNGGTGSDMIDGGNGADTLVLSSGSAAMRADLRLTGLQFTGQGRDVLRGIERVQTGTGNDLVIGANDANILSAGAGDDRLFGMGGADRLLGGAGVDTLTGGRDNDLLTGGDGADVFVFQTGHGSDRIADFQDGIDRIAIQGAMLADLAFVATAAGVVIRMTGCTVLIEDATLAQIDANDLLLS